ncbi:interferon-induced protein 44-like [Tachysurus fulvidraco]|uniref:interferon-induced protein 44-like n=1 Tax=Tachysurus fulvidraco TaxID=1234273 RepID=UPI001FEE08B3|nr:interferon-induced protein 44-like [Tachysurus fulvidraco]
MGLEDHEEDGIHPDDIINVLHGRVKEDYTFNPVTPLTDTDPDYIHEPSLNDKVHCLVSVVPANSISSMKTEMIQKMQTVRKSALSLGIPHVVLMTKIDDGVCPLVTKDLAEVYKSRKIEEKMQECSHTIGPPLKCIFPVSNYHEETEIDDKKDVLILSALKAIAEFVGPLCRARHGRQSDH